MVSSNKKFNFLEEVNRLNETSSEEDIRRVLEYDFKGESESLSVQNEEDPIKRFVLYKEDYQNKLNQIYKNKYKKNKKEDIVLFDCDRCSEIVKVYEKLGWIGSVSENKWGKKAYKDKSEQEISFETINSFNNVYKSALGVYYSEEFEFNNEDDTVRIKHSGGHFSVNSIYENLDKYERINNLQYMRDFAHLTHSAGNFMTVIHEVENNFNRAKGFGENIKDFLDLMLLNLKSNEAKILYTYNRNLIEIGYETKSRWSAWLNRNINELCLEDYFIDYSDKKTLDELTVKRLFDVEGVKHSLEYTLPKTEEQLKQCIENMNRLIIERGKRILKKLNPKLNENKNIDKIKY